MPQKAHLNGSKRDPRKGIFDPKNVIVPDFPILTSAGGTLGSQLQGFRIPKQCATPLL